MFEAFKSGFPIPPSSIVFLDIFPVGFQSSCFGLPLLFCRYQGLGCLMWNSDPSLLREISPSLWSFPAIDNHDWGMVFPPLVWQYHSPTHLMAVLLISVVKILFIQFSGVFWRELFYMELLICCICTRRWLQEHPVLPSWTLFSGNGIMSYAFLELKVLNSTVIFLKNN